MESINVTALPYLERLDEWYFNNDGIEKKFVLIISSKRWDFMVQVGIVAEKHHRNIQCV
jgi:pterin-4a-carbinolamine dehydratase